MTALDGFSLRVGAQVVDTAAPNAEKPTFAGLYGRRKRIDEAATRLLDVAVASLVLALLMPLILVVAAAIKLDSRGPIFFRCRRVGFRGRELRMLKFRKMRDGVSGAALTTSNDARFTRLGRFLAKSKLDEIPQLWNVLKGEMSLVGPRPEDPGFVELRSDDYAMILTVKPGITGLCQLAFAKENEILDSDDVFQDYVERLQPDKIALDRLYVSRRSMSMDLRIIAWTGVAVLFRRDVAVHRSTAALTRRRPRVELGGGPARTEARP
jgi:lipopolysaccharide/colanic/teichoic acid biosynthesis glycosyltransferase